MKNFNSHHATGCGGRQPIHIQLIHLNTKTTMETLKTQQAEFVANLPAPNQEDTGYARDAFRDQVAPDTHIGAAWFIGRTHEGQSLTPNHSINGGGQATAERITGVAPFDMQAAIAEGGEEWAGQQLRDYWESLEQAFAVEGTEYGFGFTGNDTYFIQYQEN